MYIVLNENGDVDGIAGRSSYLANAIMRIVPSTFKICTPDGDILSRDEFLKIPYVIRHPGGNRRCQFVQ